MTAQLPTQYAPRQVEGELYERWVARGYFTADPSSDKPPYCVVIPPPNVTGSLHLGHAFEHTLIDMLVRRRRMQGYETLWQVGMDHAGIATQNVLERELAKEGCSRHDLGREEFVDRVWRWKAESGGRIAGQMRRLGDSVDWSRERFTMDEGLSRAVLTIFARLYDDGLIYQAERIINWCPRDLTALSDIEVDHRDDDGELVSIRYGEADESIVVATTRAETMLGDTAVAVHPEDQRYQHLIGRHVALPLTDRSIPVVADAHVDPGFGTGAVKVTPAHDHNDFDIGQRHGLPALLMMDERGVVTTAGPFQGLDRFEARPAVVAALREQGRVVAEKRPYTHAVGHCSRCDTVVEPRLSLQWFVRVAPLAKAAGEAARDGRVPFVPPEMAARYFAWVDNMHDWCISRQLWWGHRIPVWYGPDGQIRVVGPDDDAPTGEGWRQDDDVLDTWFSSALWPFSTLGWPDDSPELRRFYPTSVLVTGYDIIFFWVARMMMFGLYAMDGEQPFDRVVLHGMVRDQYGKKMSKSFGNTVDPLDWMDEFGSDALRFTLARGANPGVDVPIGKEWVQGSRNFCNKLWNATRFALLNGATADGKLPAPAELSSTDRWILSRLQATIAEVDTHYESYEFAKACEVLYHFAWDEVCDWYVELAKVPLAADDHEPAARATRAVLGHVLDAVLRLLHPAVPYVTEELWTALTAGESVVVAQWPQPDAAYADRAAEQEIAALQRLVTEVRRFRAEQGLKPGQRVPALVEGLEASALRGYDEQIRALARLTAPDAGFVPTAKLPVALGTAGSAGHGSSGQGSAGQGSAGQGSAGEMSVGQAAAVAGIGVSTVTVALDLSGSIDVPAERRRLEKDLATAAKERTQAQAKLGNDAFVANAPQAVVAKVRDRLAAADADTARLEAQLAALTGG